MRHGWIRAAVRCGVAVRFLSVLSIMLAASASAWACTCGPRTADEVMSSAGIVFRGTLLTRESEIGVFSVEQVIKGTLGDQVRIRIFDDHQCGPTFRVGDSVSVMALGESEDAYWVGTCMYAPRKGERGFDELIEAAQRYRDRLQSLDDAIAGQPSDPVPLVAKGRFLSQTGTPLAGIAVLERALQLDPLHRNAIFLKADLLMQGKESLALDTLAPFLAAHPDDHEALRRRAIALARLDRLGAIPDEWRDFSGLDKDHLDFSGRTLDKASFRGNRMYFTSFAGADLRNADLSGVSMYEADFSGANLAGATLTKAQINQRNFVGANLQGADLRGANLVGDFTGANLSSAVASKSSWSSTTGFKDVKAAGLVANGSSFGNADFAGADFSDANLRDASFWSPRFADAILRNTDFTGAKFISRDARMGDLSGADLSSAKLDGVTFVSIQYDCTTKWPAGFNPEVEGLIPAADADACAKKPDFSWRKEPVIHSYWSRGTQPFTDLDLSGVSFRGAWLPGEYFWNSILREADFTRAVGVADLRGADVRGADFSYVDLYDWNFHGVEKGPANIEGAKFHGATIYLRSFLGDGRKSADLSKADLRGAIIADEPSKWPAEIDPLKAGVFFKDSATAARVSPGYSLKGADLRGYDLFQFKFGALDLSGADLRGARLEQVDLSQTQLSGAKLKGACVYPSTPWPGGFDPAAAEIIYCSRMGYGRGGPNSSDSSSAWAHSRGGIEGNWGGLSANTPVPNFINENWDEIDWQAAWLPGTNMDGGSFVHTNLKGANLVGASMKGADLTGINFNDASLDGADLSSAKLRGADLRRTSFKDANLLGADLSGALYDDVTVWPDGFDPVTAGLIREQ